MQQIGDMLHDAIRWLTWGQLANLSAIYNFLRDWALWSRGRIPAAAVPRLPRDALRSLGFWLLFAYCTTLLLALYEERRIWMADNPVTAGYMRGLWFRRAYPWWSPFEVDYALLGPALGRLSVWNHRWWFGRPPLTWLGWVWAIVAAIQDAGAWVVNGVLNLPTRIADIYTGVANGVKFTAEYVWDSLDDQWKYIPRLLWPYLRVFLLGSLWVVSLSFQGIWWLLLALWSFLNYLWRIITEILRFCVEATVRESWAWWHTFKSAVTEEPLERTAALVPVLATTTTTVTAAATAVVTAAAATMAAQVDDEAKRRLALSMPEALVGRDLLNVLLDDDEVVIL